MNRTLVSLLREGGNHICPFTNLTPQDTAQSIEASAIRLKEAGVLSMNLLWGDPALGGRLCPFNQEAYWARIGDVVNVCRKHGMTFMVQDAAPFPTGQADGWLEKPEYRHLNKLYLAERHMDARGHGEERVIMVNRLMNALHVTCSDDVLRRRFECPPDKLLRVIACRRQENCYIADSAADLTGQVQDGLLFWRIPEGEWRIFVIFETYRGGGRQGYINLLDKESVALQIRAVHQPHYEHLRNEVGKTWLGFFYDETEVGNLDGYRFDLKAGDRTNFSGSTQALPWSHEMAARLEAALGSDWAGQLPLLWVEDEGRFHHVRYAYMDAVSRLIEENYNGQVHAWCRERGILYIGHNLEDEGSHSRLGCGPVHFFRMQKYQDMAGVDLVGGQLMPEKDFTQAWYGCPEGDGAFYHYGLAKLASSAARIAPDKRGRSFAELLAVYGDISGSRLRRFVIDHLLVNGVNHMIPADAYGGGFPQAYNRVIHDYTNRMCALLNSTTPIIKTALLYHAEAEWYGGAYQPFHNAAKVLSQAQISYDVIPADVFSDRDFYAVDTLRGLVVNGNFYEALIVPASTAVPRCVAAFLDEAERTGFPVFFCERKPGYLAETGGRLPEKYGEAVPVSELAKVVGQIIKLDFSIDKPCPFLRINHMTGLGGDFYFLHNEGVPMDAIATLDTAGPVTLIDMSRMKAQAISASSQGGKAQIRLRLTTHEARLLFCGDPAALGLPVDSAEEEREEPLRTVWHVRLENGGETDMTVLRSLNARDLYPRFTGNAVYSAKVVFRDGAKRLMLEDVNDACTVFVNGIEVGKAVAPPYRFDITGIARTGENDIQIHVTTNAARAETDKYLAGAGAVSASTFNPLLPGGLTGGVWVCY